MTEHKDDGGPVNGMSLRDWFAGQALACLRHPDDHTDRACNAEWAYQIADAMLAARKEPHK